MAGQSTSYSPSKIDTSEYDYGSILHGTITSEKYSTISLSHGMKNLSICFSFLIAAFCAFDSLAQDIEFKRISLGHGAGQNTVYAITQDHRGFMWFGTQDGLYRFDGYELKAFKYDPFDSTSISASWASAIYEDSRGGLWIGTVYGGLNRFDPETEKFTRFKHDPENPNSLSSNVVFAICEDTSGAMWIGTWDGLNRITFQNEKSGVLEAEFTHYKHDPATPNSLSDNSIWAMLIDRANVLWIGTNKGGLVRFDIETQQFTRFQYDPDDPRSLSHNKVRRIFEEPRKDGRILWIATFGGGLNRFDKRTGSFTRIKHIPDEPRSLSNNNVVPILQDRNGTLWIGTQDGLNKLARSTGVSYRSDESSLLGSKSLEFVRYRHEAFDPNSLSSNWVFSLYEDKSGILWVGTIGGGVNKVASERKAFAHHKHAPLVAKHTPWHNIYSIHEDEKEELWLGTGEGLYRYDRQRDDVTFYAHRPDDPNTLSQGHITAILEQSEGETRTLWIAAYGGGLDRLLLRDDANSGTLVEEIIHYKPDSTNANGLPCDCIAVIHEDQSGKLWLGTDEGLVEFDPRQGGFTRYGHAPDDPNSLSHDRVTVIYQAPDDSGKTLWVGTARGLNRFDMERHSFTRYLHNLADSNSLGHDFVNAIYADSGSKGRVLWIGTFGGGLDRLNVDTGEFRHFTEKRGLGDNTAYGILEDDNGNLWVGTKKGVSKFDPRTEAFRNYDIDDGINCLLFIRGAQYKSNSGEMFFGGDNGFVSFFPDSIKDNPHIPPVVLTEFKIFNEPAKLPKSISATDEIELSYKQNFFSFEFAALEYTAPEKNRYAYMLEGFDEDWIYCGTRRYASYTNLDGGEYVFRVKASNNDGTWNADGASVKIIIKPPFWQTLWFRSLFLTILLCSFLGIYYARVSRYKKEKIVQQAFSRKLIEVQESERKRVASELHDSLGQDLLIIKNEIQQYIDPNAMRAPSNEELKEISEIVSQSIDEVREISYNLHPHQLDRLGLKKAINSMVKKMSSICQIDLLTEIDDIDNLFPKSEEINIYRIVQEGLTNIVRHADAEQAIIRIKEENNSLDISIDDNGKGFDLKAETGGRINRQCFGLFGIAERARIMNGKLSVKSVPGRGTKLWIRIPLPEA